MKKKLNLRGQLLRNVDRADTKMYFKFVYDFKQFKHLFFKTDHWQNIVREMILEACIEENKKLSAAVQKGTEEDYIPFAQYRYVIEPYEHKHLHKVNLNEEKLKVFKLLQEKYKEIGQPVSPYLLWHDRGRIGMTIKDYEIFEHCLFDLQQDTHLEVVSYELPNGDSYIKVKPQVALVKKTFSAKRNNPFHKKDVEMMDKAKQARLKEQVYNDPTIKKIKK